MLIGVTDVVELLEVSRSTVYRLMERHDFPKAIKVGGSVRWDFKEVDAWVEAQKAKRDGSLGAETSES
jgi:excisionase family DNA binding protein